MHKAIQAIGTYKGEQMVVLGTHKDELLIMINNDQNTIDWYKYNHADFKFTTWYICEQVA
jgi:hypothetical protein